jgi:outer membrane protein TolC
MLSLSFRFSLDRALLAAMLTACAAPCPAWAQDEPQATPSLIADLGVMAVAPTAKPAPDFWTGFNAPDLTAMIAQGLAANQDIASAKARLTVARARLGAARARLLPSVSVLVNGQKNINLSGDILQSGLQPSAELDVGYDLDLFGANKATKRAEKARAAASALDLAALQLSFRRKSRGRTSTSRRSMRKWERSIPSSRWSNG